MRSLVARVLVWMMDDGEFAISLFDVELGSVRLDAERIVVLCFLHHGGCECVVGGGCGVVVGMVVKKRRDEMVLGGGEI
jgi:hypothetical protein